MTIDQMRAEIIKVYSTSSSWKKKVANMPDEQVFAIYKSFVANGKIK